MTDSDAIRDELAAALERGVVHASYLFEGGPGTPTRETALWFCGRLLGHAGVQRALEADPSEVPPHPDLKWLEPERSAIRVGAVRQLQSELSLMSHEGGRRIGLILDAHLLRIEAANALLKLLEEPPRQAVLILVARSAQALPVTVRSRVLRYRLTARSESDLRTDLEAEGLASADAWLAAGLGGGSLEAAHDWAEAHLDQARDWLAWLEGVEERSAGEILDFAESFRGGEPARSRAEQWIQLHAVFTRRETERAAEGGDAPGVRRWLDRFEAGERARGEMRRRNLNPQLVVEGLLLDLSPPRPA